MPSNKRKQSMIHYYVSIEAYMPVKLSLYFAKQCIDPYEF